MNNKTKLKIILIAFILALIILISIVIIRNKNSKIIDTREEMEQFSKEYLEDRVIPQGIYQFTQNYHGEVERENLYTKLNVVTKYISDLSKELIDKNVNEFYAVNSEQIKNYLGIDNSEDFVKIIEKINKTNIRETSFKHCVIEKGTFETEENYTKFKLTLHYENGTTLQIQVFLTNEISSERDLLKILAE